MPRNPDIDAFLAGLDHPLSDVIEALRALILEVEPALEESVKWNAPSYARAGTDLLTLKLFPPRAVQLVLHRGVFKTAAPDAPLVPDPAGLLQWRGNDRAVASFPDAAALETVRAPLRSLIAAWLAA